LANQIHHRLTAVTVASSGAPARSQEAAGAGGAQARQVRDEGRRDRAQRADEV